MGVFNDPRPLIERPRIRDVFANDLGRIDVWESNVRLNWCTEAFREEGAVGERLLTSKLIIPRLAVLPAVNRILFTLGYHALISGADSTTVKIDPVH